MSIRLRITVFGLGVVEAPFTVESGPPEVVDMLARWSGRFAGSR